MLVYRSEEGNTTLCTPSLSLHFAYQIANQLSVTRKHRGGKMFSEHRQHWSHALYPRLQHFSAWHTRAAAQLSSFLLTIKKATHYKPSSANKNARQIKNLHHQSSLLLTPRMCSHPSCDGTESLSHAA